MNPMIKWRKLAEQEYLATSPSGAEVRVIATWTRTLGACWEAPEVKVGKAAVRGKTRREAAIKALDVMATPAWKRQAERDALRARVWGR